MLSFSRDPKGYIQDLLRSQSRDLKVKGTPGALVGREAYWEDSKCCYMTVRVGVGGPGSRLTPLLPPR